MLPGHARSTFGLCVTWSFIGRRSGIGSRSSACFGIRLWIGSGIVAMCGLARHSNPDNRIPSCLGTLHTDFTVPFMGASVIMAALQRRERTGGAETAAHDDESREQHQAKADAGEVRVHVRGRLAPGRALGGLRRKSSRSGAHRFTRDLHERGFLSAPGRGQNGDQ